MQYRQGDVLIEKIDSMPESNQLQKDEYDRVVLAYGEVTGHAHAFYDEHAFLHEPKKEPSYKGERYLKLVKPSTLKHEEHSKILHDPGIYRVRRQREWTDSEEPIMVAD